MQNWLKGAVIALVSAAVALAVSQMIREPVEGQAPDSGCRARWTAHRT